MKVVPRAEEPAPEAKQLALFVARGHVELPGTTSLLEAQLHDALVPKQTTIRQPKRLQRKYGRRQASPPRLHKQMTLPAH